MLAYNISQNPDFAVLDVQLQPGQRLFAEPASMVAMDTSIKLRSSMRGGLMRSVRRLLGGESLVLNTFSAPQQAGSVSLAPGPLGDIVHYPMQHQPLYLQRGAFLAHSEGVEISSQWDGARGFFSGQGLFLLKATGVGDLFFNTYGALMHVDVQGTYYVDTGYVVAFEHTLNHRVTVLPGASLGGKVASFFFGGERLVCRFEGYGKVWIQTRATPPFLSWLYPYRRVQKRS
jgi:uncharacterized protein (TIGR00266 family)